MIKSPCSKFKEFYGLLTDIEVDFKDKLKELVPALLGRDNLIVKEINGCQVTCRDLVEYFKVLCQ